MISQQPVSTSNCCFTHFCSIAKAKHQAHTPQSRKLQVVSRQLRASPNPWKPSRSLKLKFNNPERGGLTRCTNSPKPPPARQKLITHPPQQQQTGSTSRHSVNINILQQTRKPRAVVVHDAVVTPKKELRREQSDREMNRDQVKRWEFETPMKSTGCATTVVERESQGCSYSPQVMPVLRNQEPMNQFSRALHNSDINQHFTYLQKKFDLTEQQIQPSFLVIPSRQTSKRPIPNPTKPPNTLTPPPPPPQPLARTFTLPQQPPKPSSLLPLFHRGSHQLTPLRQTGNSVISDNQSDCPILTPPFQLRDARTIISHENSHWSNDNESEVILRKSGGSIISSLRIEEKRPRGSHKGYGNFPQGVAAATGGFKKHQFMQVEIRECVTVLNRSEIQEESDMFQSTTKNYREGEVVEGNRTSNEYGIFQ